MAGRMKFLNKICMIEDTKLSAPPYIFIKSIERNGKYITIHYITKKGKKGKIYQTKNWLYKYLDEIEHGHPIYRDFIEGVFQKHI